MPDGTYCVADYLNDRLVEIGMTDIFGVPGNFVAPFLNVIEYDQQYGRKAKAIRFHTCTNENIAAYACEGAARAGGLRHPSALFVTAGVGSLSAANPISGCFMEKVPMLVINGVFTREQRITHELTGMLASHMMHNPQAELRIMENICAATGVVSDPDSAPVQIDRAIVLMLRHSQPVYLEIEEDVFRMPCARPKGILAPAKRVRPHDNTDLAVEATKQQLRTYDRPLIFAGAAIQRWGLQDVFAELVETTDIPYVTSLLSKSVLSEDTPQFAGQFEPQAIGDPDQQKSAYARTDKTAVEQVEKANILIQIGVAKVTVNYSGYPLLDSRNIAVGDGSVMIGTRMITNVDMETYLRALTKALRPKSARSVTKRLRALPSAKSYPPGDEVLGYVTFGQTLDVFLNKADAAGRPPYTLVSDAGFVLRTVTSVHISRRDGFVSQADWLAIGFSTAAALGIDKVCAEARTIVAVGDGAFQETATALSDLVYQGSNAIVLVLDNGLHGVEQFLVNPNPFRTVPNAYPQDSTQEKFSDYNRLHRWSYVKLAEAFGAIGHRVQDVSELKAALTRAEEDTEHVHLIQVVFEASEDAPSKQLPHKMREEIDRPEDSNDQFFGEDEYLHRNWPKW